MLPLRSERRSNPTLRSGASMRLLPRLSSLLAALALTTLVPAAIPGARAAANHVVISEFASRGPASATDEFIELYNPTDNPISLSGWKLQYSAATNGATWSDRAILPANASIPGHGFYMIANQTSYSVTNPEYTSVLWNPVTVMEGHRHTL